VASFQVLQCGLWNIEKSAFDGCISLTEILFQSDWRLKGVKGFQGRGSGRRVEMPASVEGLCVQAISGCEAITEVIFSVNGCLRSVCEFQGCIALCRVEIHAAPFMDSTALRVVLFGLTVACGQWAAFGDAFRFV
jgi:hypothetical protein